MRTYNPPPTAMTIRKMLESAAEEFERQYKNEDGLSVDVLDSFGKKLQAIAQEMKKKQPSYSLAIEAGIQDRSYSTVRWGTISKYSGEATIEMADGSIWKAIGHGPRGTAEYVSSEGYIEFILVREAQEAETA